MAEAESAAAAEILGARQALAGLPCLTHYLIHLLPTNTSSWTVERPTSKLHSLLTNGVLRVAYCPKHAMQTSS